MFEDKTGASQILGDKGVQIAIWTPKIRDRLDQTVTIAVPGTCGELVQGWDIDWEQAVLVSCPIPRYSWASPRRLAPHHVSP